VDRLVVRPEEQALLRELAATDPRRHWDRLLFSIKESIYKAWFPLARRWLDFQEASVTIDPAGSFHGRLLVPGPIVAGTPLAGLQGRWLIDNGLVLSAVSVGPATLDPPGGTAQKLDQRQQQQ
jgi:4'-phosphopantetheinyl transferase EntD